jgi:PadR family transcriptional regulator, regulatory protein AphA
VEFAAMLKVFFADAGSLEQLHATIDHIQDEAHTRIAALAEMAAVRPVGYPQRAHLSAVSLRLQLEQEQAVLRWAVWARRQITLWSSTTDPGRWDSLAALDEIAAPAHVGDLH